MGSQAISDRSEPRPVRVLVVDDSPLFRKGMASLLAEEAAIEIVGFADNGRDAADLAAQLRPDVVLMDIHMPIQGGISATRSIVERMPGTRVILLTGLWFDERRQDAAAVGAWAVLSKNVNVAEIVTAIRSAAAGATPPSGQQGGRRKESPPVAEVDRLTGREIEILAMLAKGYHSARIAGELQLRQKTVRNYISVIYDKLGVHGRSRAVLYAARAGLLDELG